ncbi:ABC transporter ATP-binding protein [Aminipila terrae]|uniref:ABC-type quaternary amine transporter n=1 Tax=Aminipila terrae TaxID=2697030 RepID=A0A6P1MI21_9FIRM|nr:ABC transporter ATP-binding protein [Aminipila terrae]QHI73547.1 ATP-binding cassette domain-containing protein [Aminipila terrae]
MELSLKNISVTLSQKQILDSISLTVEDGAFISLLGASGCGKSTLLKTIAGIITPASGSVFLNGSCADHVPSHKRGTVIVFQDLRLFPHMTVMENIAFPMKMQGVVKVKYLETAGKLLEKVQLQGFEQRRIREMSGGQLQRVALARALAANPNVLLLDEPFSSLDENLRQDMRQLVLKLQKDFKITTILVTHDRQEALSMSDKIALMMNGKILQYDTPENIYNFPASRDVADFFQHAAYLDGAVENHVYKCEIGQFQVDKPDGHYQAMFRPGSVYVDKMGSEKNFQICEMQYRGEDYKVRLVSEKTGLMLTAFIASSSELQTGDMVSIGIIKDKVLLFPYSSF